MKSRPPLRGPIALRPQAPRPARAPGARGRLGPLALCLAELNRRLYGLRIGRWLRRRLERGLELAAVEIALARGGPGLHGLRVAYLSDLHAGTFMEEDDLLRLFERVAAQEPDLVCLGGDLVNSRPDEALLYRRPLALLDPPLGTFAVPGNHEYAVERDLKLYRDVLSEAGARLLVNEGQRIARDGSSLWLAGVDDLCLGRPDVGLAMHGVRADEPVLLLSHHPDFFCEAASVGVDLTISGHTHGGQILFGGRTPLRHTRLGYWRGRFEADGAQLYVGRGAGVTLLPLRIGAPAEVPILHLSTR